MSYRVLYAPDPPQFTLDLSAEQFARHDARFADLAALRGRGALPATVQDSADLQRAYLTVREGRAEWRGTPSSPSGPGTGCPVAPLLGWGERALTYGLALDLGRARVREVDPACFGEKVLTWPVGAVYLLTGAPPVLTRRLNLAEFCDRLEIEFLTGAAFGGFAVVRAHRLAADGTHEVLRAGCLPP